MTKVEISLLTQKDLWSHLILYNLLITRRLISSIGHIHNQMHRFMGYFCIFEENNFYFINSIPETL